MVIRLLTTLGMYVVDYISLIQGVLSLVAMCFMNLS